MTRTANAHLFASVDGVVEAPDQWQFDAFGPDEGALMGAAISGVTDVVIGRVLWEEWSEYWPGADDPFGAFINPVRKHVIGSSLTGELAWNSTAIDGDPVAYVRALKNDGEGAISVVGGIETVRSLFLAGVVDNLTLTVHPVIAGKGQRLFDDSLPVTRLTMTDHTVTSVGNAVLTYALRES
ncbi:dihydrofolate reductase [Mumia flava]|uniref:Dihydrofolate reductase n=1 Tax=Mumia flava TaxID=1348852 RepID=A0A0B2BT79_9ACTN|nr:dihydrofolate reductase family protein [Mumia flava]PJJ57235.1 dihydrofolate reductase [Mumia flava]